MKKIQYTMASIDRNVRGGGRQNAKERENFFPIMKNLQCNFNSHSF